MDYLYEYLLFLAQSLTVIVVIVIVLTAVASLSQKRHDAEGGHLEVRKLNERLDDLRHTIEDTVLSDVELKAERKRQAREEKEEARARKEAARKAAEGEPPARTRLFVMDFDGDIEAASTEHLRTEITAVLTLARPEDSVLVRLTSAGGMVPHYGLAASQLLRVRKHGIPLIVAVDKMAASGGYLMAAVANRVIAAPFALVGSIGVVAEVPNVHRLLDKHDVDWEVFTAGQYKRTLTVFGENTEEGRRKFIEELEETHSLFKSFVLENRPGMDMDRVATGEAWYGRNAVALNLVDEILTSDEFVTVACEDKDVYEVHWVEHRKPLDRLLGELRGVVARVARLMAPVR
jgi:serine protease SohB